MGAGWLQSADTLRGRPKAAHPAAAFSKAAASRVRRLPRGPCLLALPVAGAAEPAVVPARRLASPDAVRLHLPHTAGLEFRPKALVHALRELGMEDDAGDAS